MAEVPGDAGQRLTGAPQALDMPLDRHPAAGLTVDSARAKIQARMEEVEPEEEFPEEPPGGMQRFQGR